jgi:hypothetical protein
MRERTGGRHHRVKRSRICFLCKEFLNILVYFKFNFVIKLCVRIFTECYLWNKIPPRFFPIQLQCNDKKFSAVNIVFFLEE